ncbi:hypothetical protein BJV78DRAFT_1121592 [Lactifluus subvellereus]|nr:hypothetical protein BJV78DRAFT_1121592 [Lactifluus subvellereus]
MAKSTRSKVKRAFRAKKRTEGVFAATEAARLQRLNAKLRAITTTAAAAGEDSRQKEKKEQEHGDDDVDTPGSWVQDGTAPQKFTGKISTHGPRGSRRECWRVSKGMAPRSKSRGMNRQGTAAARYKPGRSHRRR